MFKLMDLTFIPVYFQNDCLLGQELKYNVNSEILAILFLRISLRHILRKTIEGYLDSVPSLIFNTIKTLLIMHAFHSPRHLQSKWMLYFSHVSMVQVQY